MKLYLHIFHHHKKIISFLALILAPLAAHAEFPENKTYLPGDDVDALFTAQSMHNTNKIAITFDDGPDESLTPKVLKLLKRYGYPATFFLVGDQITPKTIPIIKRAIQEGHLIGSHSLHHDNSNTMSEAQFKSDLKFSIQKVRDVIQASGHAQNEVYFRFPFGDFGEAKDYHHFNAVREISEELYGENCINLVFWTIDASDGWGLMPAKDIVKNVFSNFDGGTRKSIEEFKNRDRVVSVQTPEAEFTHGGVLLLHDVQRKTIRALPAILAEIKRRNIEVVPLNQVQEYQFKNRQCGNLEASRSKKPASFF